MNSSISVVQWMFQGSTGSGHTEGVKSSICDKIKKPGSN